MTSIGKYSFEEFKTNFPIDLGEGVRAALISGKTGVDVGLIMAHMKPESKVCAASVFWHRVENMPVWILVKREPLTLTPSVRCSCGLHGYIEEGKWRLL